MATLTSEKWITTHEGLSLWSETFGVAGDKPVLLIMGAMNPALFWPDEFCLALAGRGLRVIRYDHRDTGRSTKVDFARHPYTLDDLTDDAKLAFVVGNLDRPEVSVVMRFVGFGLTLELSEWAASILHNDGLPSNTEMGAENDH